MTIAAAIANDSRREIPATPSSPTSSRALLAQAEHQSDRDRLTSAPVVGTSHTARFGGGVCYRFQTGYYHPSFSLPGPPFCRGGVRGQIQARGGLRLAERPHQHVHVNRHACCRFTGTAAEGGDIAAAAPQFSV